jgi:two-component system sensor histidine kinase/response regulator
MSRFERRHPSSRRRALPTVLLVCLASRPTFAHEGGLQALVTGDASWQSVWPFALAGLAVLTTLALAFRWHRHVLRTLALKAHSESLSARRREEAEHALRATERQLRQLVQSVKAIVWRMDASTARFTFVSQEAEELLGYSVRRWLDDSHFLESIQHPDDREWVSRYARRATTEQRDHSMDYRVFAQDGRVVWLRNIVTVIIEEGQPIELVGVMTDISEYKAAEDALEAAHAQALAATRAKSEFLASMSHEIRTPMNAVIGLTGILLETPLQPDQRQLIETVRASGDALLSIINDILDFSKVESGKLQLETIAFDLGTVVEEVVSLMAERAATKSLELTCLVDADVPADLVGDPGRIRQVLLNLVGNAIKFTARGDVAVRVTLQHEAPGKVVVRCEVRDTGVGVPREAQARLFEAFTQADASTTRRFGGTGLGLAISRRMIELMGGNIGVDSQPGLGSTFWFVVPLGRSGAQPVAVSASTALHGLRALVVDHKSSTQLILSHVLGSAGLDVRVVPSATEALALAREAASPPADIVLIDHALPDGDALSLVDGLRSALGRQVPAVLLTPRLTNLPTLTDASLARVIKPVRRQDLVDTVTRLATQVPSPAALEAAALPALSSTAPCPATLLAPAASSQTAGHASTPASSDARAIHVLVAEDNVVNQKVARLMLERVGCRVDMVEDGEQAVAAVQRTAYDLVLMDCQMPVVDGLEATRRIRGLPGPVSRTVIVALTANALSGDRDRCISAGMDDYLAKPVRREALDEVLSRWARARGSQPAA